VNSPKIKRQKAKGKRQKSELRRNFAFAVLPFFTQGNRSLKLLPFAFCLLPFDLCHN
jgi:hypothetical protein